jgi:hypothetical protein
MITARIERIIFAYRQTERAVPGGHGDKSSVIEIKQQNQKKHDLKRGIHGGL